MRKIFPIIAIIIIILIVNVNSNDKSDKYVIPSSAIRLRIKANSNSTYDQYIKDLVKKRIENKLNIIDSSTLENTRISIEKNIPIFKEEVSNLFKEKNYEKAFTISYGNHFFPEKEYKSIIYNAGEYESLFITIGSGKGDNWWCVLFPPICNLDFTDQTSDIEYKLYIKDMFDKYFIA